MIPQAYINEWRNIAPWATDAQIEQDLILSRALIEVFNNPLLAKSLGFRQKHFKVNSLWFNNEAMITSFSLEELLGTKLRALYQRKKGRDLFDLTTAIKQFPTLDISKLINCFNQYIAFENSNVSRAE